MLRVLADETRLGVVRELFAGPCHVHELMALLDIDQSLLSHHLRTLRDCGLVESERDGKAVLYRLSPSVEPKRRGCGLDLGCCRISFDAHWMSEGAE